MRRPAVVLTALAALVAVARRRGKAQQAERDLWTEATAPPEKPDLR